MRRYYLYFLSVATLLIASCGTLTTAQREALQTAVQDSLKLKRYTINMSMMYPQRGAAHNITSNWSLVVKRDTLVSYLPYVGVADYVPFGGGKGMNFTAPISKYNSTTDTKGKTTVLMKVRNEEEQMEFHIEIQPEGQSFVDVIFRNRDHISYSGTLDADY